MIYFLRAGDAVKIGFSTSPETAIRRLVGFQTANARDLMLLAVIPGTLQDEATLHRTFKHLHLRGEWYAAAETLLDFIAQQQGNHPMTTDHPPDQRPPLAFTDLNPTAPPPRRLSSSFRGVDQVLGGGFVPGSVILLSGDPGAGKSTLLLQIAAYVGCRGYRAAYVSAEEAADQVKLRAQRLGVARAPVMMAATGDAAAVFASLAADAPLNLLVVDSLQTYTLPTVTSPRGSPNQTRAVLAATLGYAHDFGTAVVVISHVNKANRAAGTNDLQHDVDVLLHLHALEDRRILRAGKNRYGPTDVTASFRMTAEGFRE